MTPEPVPSPVDLSKPTPGPVLAPSADEEIHRVARLFRRTARHRDRLDRHRDRLDRHRDRLNDLDDEMDRITKEVVDLELRFGAAKTRNPRRTDRHRDRRPAVVAVVWVAIATVLIVAMTAVRTVEGGLDTILLASILGLAGWLTTVELRQWPR